MGKRGTAGERHGRLVAIEQVGARSGNAVWRFACDCGNEKVASMNSARTGKVHSCGCFRSESSRARVLTHGDARSRTYRIWRHMLNRCYMEKHPKYPRYGGRGIAVCDAWRSYEGFIGDMGRAPEGLTIERIDNNGPYAPGNCRWATFAEQAANRSVCRYFRIDGRTQHLAAWARELDMNPRTFAKRYEHCEVDYSQCG